MKTNDGPILTPTPEAQSIPNLNVFHPARRYRRSMRQNQRADLWPCPIDLTDPGPAVAEQLNAILRRDTRLARAPQRYYPKSRETRNTMWKFFGGRLFHRRLSKRSDRAPRRFDHKACTGLSGF